MAADGGLATAAQGTVEADGGGVEANGGDAQPTRSSVAGDALPLATREASPPPAGEAARAEESTVRLLLISGNSSDFKLADNMTISQVKMHIMERWPTEWMGEEQVDGIDRMRILHKGRFLDDRATVAELALPAEEVSTMHLILRLKSAEDGRSAYDKNGDGRWGSKKRSQGHQHRSLFRAVCCLPHRH